MNILERKITRPALRHLVAVLLLAIATVSLSSISRAGSVDPASAGDVHFAFHMYTPFDIYTDNPRQATKNWLNSHFERLMAYSTYFDTRLSWYPNAWDYVNSRGFA